MSGDIKKNAKMLYKTIREDIDSVIDDRGYDVFFNISAGAYAFDTNTDTYKDIIKNTRFALHKAKLNGKNRFEFFDKADYANYIKRLEIQGELRSSVNDNFKGFEFFSQPIVDADTGRIEGAEALLRWKSDQYGFMSPVEFIPLLEESSLIIPLGRWIIDTAAAQKHQLLAVVLPCRMDHIHLQDHIFIHEIRQCLTVGHDAAHLGCGQEHIVRLLPGKELLHGILSAQIQFLMAAGDDIGISVSLECSTNSTSYHTLVAGYIYFCVFFHDITVLPLFISPVIPRFPSTLPLQPLPASDRALPSDGTVPRSWFSGDSIPAPCGPSSDLPTD